MSAGERERLQNLQRRVRSGNRDEVRALARTWGVPQKAAGKNRSVHEMRRDLEEKIATALAEPVADQDPATVLTEPVAAQGESPHADHTQATVLAEPVAAQRDGQEGDERDVRDPEMRMDRGLSAEPDEAMALAEPVADQGDDGVARKVARTDPGKALEFVDRAEVLWPARTWRPCQ